MDELSTVLSLVVELWFQFTVIILPGPPVLGFQPLPVLQLSNTAHSMLYILLQFHNRLSKTPRGNKSQELTAHPLCKLPQINCIPIVDSAP